MASNNNFFDEESDLDDNIGSNGQDFNEFDDDFDEPEERLGGKSSDVDQSVDSFLSIGQDETNNLEGKKTSSIKPYIIIVGIGLALLPLFFIGMRYINSVTFDGKPTAKLPTKPVVSDKEVEKPKSNSQKNNQVDSNSSENTDNKPKDTDWVSFEKVVLDKINAVDSTFSITAIKFECQKSNESSQLNLVGILKGRIDGFEGSYELVIPYSKASLLEIGNKFNVKISVGSYKNVDMICGIEY